MSNVKKCLIFKKAKNQNRYCFYATRPGFLLLEFVVTLGITIVSITMFGSLLHTVAQIQQATAQRAQLIDGVAVSLNNREVNVGWAINQQHVQLIFDGVAHAAWRNRWKGQSFLPEEPIRLSAGEVGFQGRKSALSVRCMRGLM